ncbi:creatininase family protein [Salinicola corii]|uniref:Creatininase family protein n=1 Tax=Salinicola corii TaxID=2606937 RepID=A0A640WJD4_9GAMM|nr:creatininase family protein [Salinicola corii]KAA0020700.1 creatininase family protein [Salinicola corii]
MSVHEWQELTTTEMAGLVDAGTVAVLPLAAIEQHGAHLPLSTDLDIGLGLLEAAAARLAPDRNVILLPPLALGSSLEHADFTGTLSLLPETAIAVIEALGEAVSRAGIRRLVLFNSHGGNKAVIDLAALKLRARHAMLVVKANYFRFTPPAQTLPAEELRHGLHGGALETSMMLHLAPDKVRVARLADAVSEGRIREQAGSTLGPEGDAGYAWMAQDLHASGVTGNATLADAETGRRLVDHFGARLAQVIEEAGEFDLDTLRQRHPASG